MIHIRHFKAADTETLWQIHFNTIRNINIQDYTQAQIEAWAPETIDISVWASKIKSLNPYIAVMNGLVVGYTDLQPSGLIDHFFCHHEHQGQGVGGALMRHVLSIGQGRGVKRYYSEVSITARFFYEHFGFIALTEKEEMVRGQMLKNYLMVKSVE